MVKIAHATKDERGKFLNGQSGDQKGDEVCIRTWYNKPWQYMIRFKDKAIAEKVAKAMELACTNNKIGYDQNQRNTLLTHARKVGYDPSKVTTACETDCSALVALACMYAGVPESALVVSGNSANTRNLRSLLLKTGLVEVYTDTKYLSGDNYLLRGDILLKEGSHVVVAIENGSKAVTTNVTTTPVEYTRKQFVKEVQTAIDAEVDGLVGTETKSKVVEISKKKNNKHKSVLPLQKRLKSLGFDCGELDGVYGTKCENAVKQFQKKYGLEIDGVCGKDTWSKILAIK